MSFFAVDQDFKDTVPVDTSDELSIVSAHPNVDSYLQYNMSTLRSLINEWKTAFPYIQPFFAVKCNPDIKLMSILYEEGSGFDCASRKEIEAALEVQVNPSRVIYANTCKRSCDIMFAAKHGINTFTADNPLEVEKIAEVYRQLDNGATGRIALRINMPNDEQALCNFGDKFGAVEEEWPAILETIKKQSSFVSCVGVSFHVGTGLLNPAAYIHAISQSATCFDLIRSFGFTPTLLDIGGGFSAPLPADIVHAVNSSIEKYRPTHFGPNVKIIAEPGRFFAERVCTLFTRVIGKRVRGDLRSFWIYEGIYGCFSEVHSGYMTPKVEAATYGEDVDPTKTYKSVVYGCGCSGVDIVVENVFLPDLNIGDTLEFKNMGAYTISRASDFNGMDYQRIHKTYIGEDLQENSYEISETDGSDLTPPPYKCTYSYCPISSYIQYELICK